MHELALAESVVQIITRKARAAGAERISAVRLEIGALSHVSPQALRFSFDAAARGSLADGARLEIDTVPGRAWCADCAGEVEIAARGAPCPGCGGYALAVTGGEEMRVRDMEVR